MKRKSLYETYQARKNLTAAMPTEYTCTDLDLADFEDKARKKIAKEMLEYVIDWLGKEAKE